MNEDEVVSATRLIHRSRERLLRMVEAMPLDERAQRPRCPLADFAFGNCEDDFEVFGVVAGQIGGEGVGDECDPVLQLQ